MNRQNLSYRKNTKAIVINKQGEILLVQNETFSNNEWTLPGGGIEEGEDAEIAIKREVVEEVGLDIQDLHKVDFIHKYDWTDEDVEKITQRTGKPYRGQETVFFVAILGDNTAELKIKKGEIRKATWVRKDKLKEFLIFPGQLDLINTVLSRAY